MRNLLVMSLLMLVLSGCYEQESPSGELYVSVLQGNRIVTAATVTIVQTEQQAQTDEFGSVLFTDLPVGSIEVIAEKTDVGKGKNIVTIGAAKLTKLTVVLN